MTTSVITPVSAREASESAWIANTVHQAYHQYVPGTWRECHMTLCEFLRNKVEGFEASLRVERCN